MGPPITTETAVILLSQPRRQRRFHTLPTCKYWRQLIWWCCDCVIHVTLWRRGQRPWNTSQIRWRQRFIIEIFNSVLPVNRLEDTDTLWSCHGNTKKNASHRFPDLFCFFFFPKRKPLFSRLQAKLVNKGLLHTFENSSPEEQQERRGGWSHRSGRAAPVPSGRVRSLALGDSVTTPVCSTVFPLARRGKVGVKGAEACTIFHQPSSEKQGFLFFCIVFFFSLS